MHSMKKRGNSAYEDYFLYMPPFPFSSLSVKWKGAKGVAFLLLSAYLWIFAKKNIYLII